MKLSFSTLGCPDWSFDQILDNAERYGFQGIELRGIGSELRIEKLPPFMPGNQQDTLRKLQKHHLRIISVGTSVKFDDPVQSTEMQQEGRAAVDICARMHIPYLRVFGDHLQGDQPIADAVRNAANGIRMLCDYAQGTDVKVLLEVHGDFNRAERILATAEQVSSDKFGIIWDIEHTNEAYGNQFASFYQAVSPYVRHVHVKDYVRTASGIRCCPVGEGSVPIPDIVYLLENSGYDGFFSFEWEKRWFPDLPDAETVFPHYISFMRKL